MSQPGAPVPKSVSLYMYLFLGFLFCPTDLFVYRLQALEDIKFLKRALPQVEGGYLLPFKKVIGSLKLLSLQKRKF